MQSAHDSVPVDASAVPLNALYAVKRLRHIDYMKDVSLNEEAKVLRALEGVKGVPRLIHAHIPDRPSADNMPYLIMEPVGIPLSQYLYEGIFTSPDDQDTAVASLNSALDATHKLAPDALVERANRVFDTLMKTLEEVAVRCWSHVDICPSNIIWAGDRAILIDWGSAKRLYTGGKLRCTAMFKSEFFDVVDEAFDKTALALTYSAMLHGGRGLAAPWALHCQDQSIADAKKTWYKTHMQKVPSCPCLNKTRAVGLLYALPETTTQKEKIQIMLRAYI
jgi:serine/threonine protein kinase